MLSQRYPLRGHQSAQAQVQWNGVKTHPSLQLIRGPARQPTPMFLIGSPGREDDNLSSGAAQLPSVVRADSCPPRLPCTLNPLRSPLALDASQVSLLYKFNIQAL